MTLIMPRLSSKNGLVKSVIFSRVGMSNRASPLFLKEVLFVECKICSLMHNQQRLMHDCHVETMHILSERRCCFAL